MVPLYPLYFFTLIMFWLKEGLKKVIIFVYSTFICFRTEDTLFFPVYINRELVIISLTKVWPTYVSIKPIEDEMLQKTTPVLLKYTLGYRFDHPLDLVDRNTCEEITVDLKHVLQENLRKIR